MLSISHIYYNGGKRRYVLDQELYSLMCTVCTKTAYFPESNLQKPAKTSKQHNVLPIWGNEQTMNLNPLILANIQGSSYFKGR